MSMTDLLRFLDPDEKAAIEANNTEFFKLARKKDKTETDRQRMRELRQEYKRIVAWKGGEKDV